MEQEEQNRSEAPSTFKLSRARKKGQVARGLDLSFLTGLVAFLAFAWVEGVNLAIALARAMRDALVTSAQLADDRGTLFSITAMLGTTIERPLLILAGVIFTVVLSFEVLQTGLVFSSEPLKLDFGKLNPAKGFKRLFSFRLLIETAKNIFKLGLYVAASWLVIRGLLLSDIGSVGDAASLVRVIAYASTRLLLLFAGAAAFFTIVDQLITRRDFVKRMRMSRRELKREARDREGEPRLKQKRKQMHGEFVRTSRSLRGLRGADMLIVNPHHIAVALRYDPARMSAPLIVSLGLDTLALRLKRLAFVYGIPIIEDPVLARALLRGASIDQAIPADSFKPVADLYNRLRRQRERKN